MDLPRRSTPGVSVGVAVEHPVNVTATPSTTIPTAIAFETVIFILTPFIILSTCSCKLDAKLLPGLKPVDRAEMSSEDDTVSDPITSLRRVGGESYSSQDQPS
jgi:hypothetical protein